MLESLRQQPVYTEVFNLFFSGAALFGGATPYFWWVVYVWVTGATEGRASHMIPYSSLHYSEILLGFRLAIDWEWHTFG